MNPEDNKRRVGELRPSQLLHTFGVGALVDLPNLSVVVMGLNDWEDQYGKLIIEEISYLETTCPEKKTR